MATKTMKADKSVDLPPRGERNADPITDAPGSHPIETGIGAALGGAAAGMATGAVTGGPIGAAVGAVAGAVAGGYAGKGIGEMIDPTTEDSWLRDNYTNRPYYRQGDTFETHLPAYQYGAAAEAQYGDREFTAIEPDLERDWVSDENRDRMEWDRARSAIKDAYDRSCYIRKQRAR